MGQEQSRSDRRFRTKSEAASLDQITGKVKTTIPEDWRQIRKLLGTVKKAEAAFKTQFPDYPESKTLDNLRKHEFGRLDEERHVYLDYTGASLYGRSQLEEYNRTMLSGVFGNPHSSNPTSMSSTVLVEETRERVLRYFNASPSEYVVIFTANASGALKLLGEAYPFSAENQYVLLADNHNSVNGIREFATSRGSSFTYAPVLKESLTIDEGRLNELLAQERKGLFAYPAQSNYSGIKHDLAWVKRAREAGWDVLLDAAAFVPTNRLDLSTVQPDFACVSFYKIFGFPAGIGALIARKSALSKLHRPWFAGGTVVAATTVNAHLLQLGGEAFEDGTLNFLGIPAVRIGLDFIENYVNVDVLGHRIRCFTGWLLTTLTKLRHQNGKPLVSIYGSHDTAIRGGTLSMNFFDYDGQLIDHRIVESEANLRRISLRTGCFCNPGCAETALDFRHDLITSCFAKFSAQPVPPTDDEFRDCLEVPATGAVRISLGVATVFAEVYRFAAFATIFINRNRTHISPLVKMQSASAGMQSAVSSKLSIRLPSTIRTPTLKNIDFKPPVALDNDKKKSATELPAVQQGAKAEEGTGGLASFKGPDDV